MQKLYKKIDLPADLILKIQQCAIDEMNTLDLKTDPFFFLAKPQKILNDYMTDRYPEIPAISECILFRRPAGVRQGIHVDSRGHQNPVRVNCAINIPLINCDTSYMNWYEGEHNLTFKELVGEDGTLRRFFVLTWVNESEVKCIESVVINQSTLVKVCVPHEVSVTQELRCMLTFRFKTNPTFDEIASMIE